MFLTIHKIGFLGAPLTNQKVTIRYRLASDDDEDINYTVIQEDIIVESTGELLSPVTVDVENNTEYVFQIINNCNVKNINIYVASCSEFSILTENGDCLITEDLKLITQEI